VQFQRHPIPAVALVGHIRRVLVAGLHSFHSLAVEALLDSHLEAGHAQADLLVEIFADQVDNLLALDTDLEADLAIQG
jgi:hypothetical protein